MITLLIFSRNRPLQLEALLASLQRWAAGVFDTFVLYRCDPDFEEGYRRLVERYGSAVHFVHRTFLKTDILVALGDAGPHACFMTDDDLLYRPVDARFLEYFSEDVLCMSLRLGCNTTHCYPVNKPQALPEFQQYGIKWIKWNWTDAELDFGYPFSIDGHIFRTSDLHEAVQKNQFQTPTEFEDYWVQTAVSGREHMLAYTTSRLVNLPLNLVQTAYPNRSEGGSLQDLNDRFLAGYVMDAEHMDFSRVTSSHFALALKLRQQV